MTAHPNVGRVSCARCEVRFHPDRTDGVCPVCRTAPADLPDRPSPRLVIDDTRTAVVLFMSACNLLALAVLALVMLH